jgi:hypothetical protein
MRELDRKTPMAAMAAFCAQFQPKNTLWLGTTVPKSQATWPIRWKPERKTLRNQQAPSKVPEWTGVA